MHLQLLFPSAVWLTADALTSRLREFHPSLAQAHAEVMTGALVPGSDKVVQFARVRWDQHTVHVVFFGEPVSTEVLDRTVETANYDEILKARARAHTAYAGIVYKGGTQDRMEQYEALAKIAAALIPLGAIVVSNPNAFTSYPASDLSPRPGEDMDEVLRTLPLMAFFVGFVKVWQRGVKGLWIRTCGAPHLDMPDLAVHIRDQDETPRVFLMFKSIFAAMRESGVRFKPGDMVDEGEAQWKFRKPRPNEGFLHSSRMIVLEPDPDGIKLPDL